MRINGRSPRLDPDSLRRHLGPVLKSTFFISSITQQDDVVERYVRQLGSLASCLEKCTMGDKSLSLGIDQLVRKLFSRVGWIGRTGDAAGPDDAEVDDCSVNVVGREESKHVAFLPLKDMLEATAKGNREIFNLAECVRTVRVAVNEDRYRGCQLPYASAGRSRSVVSSNCEYLGSPSGSPCSSSKYRRAGCQRRQRES